MALKAAHHFVARRMNLPARPGFLEAVHRDDAAFIEIVAMALLILVVPFEAGELGFRNGSCAEPQMNRMFEQ